jgi:hypothetical protein
MESVYPGFSAGRQQQRGENLDQGGLTGAYGPSSPKTSPAFIITFGRGADFKRPLLRYEPDVFGSEPDCTDMTRY